MNYVIKTLEKAMMFNFIQNNILRMVWLNDLVGSILKIFRIDLNTKIGEAIQFFIYDVLKIFILLCALIFIVSYIQSFFPPERSKKIMGKFKGISANIVAALLGTVTPFCSCSSIPLFIGFTSAGLPLGVTFSFLISSPMVDLGSLILLMSIFGAKIAVAYVLLGLVIAVIGGKIIESAKMENEIEEFILNANVGEVSQSEMTIEDRINFSKDQVVSTFKKVYPYVLVGVGIGAIIHNWIPQDFIEKILGQKSILGVVIATLVGAPMYADIFGTIPVAEALFAKGALLGTVLSFMMAVTTLSLPSMIMLRRAIKPRLLRLFIIICVIGIIIVGYIFNIFSYLFI